MFMSINKSTGIYKPMEKSTKPSLTAESMLRKYTKEIQDEEQRNLTYNLMISSLNGNENANGFLSPEEVYMVDVVRDVYRK